MISTKRILAFLAAALLCLAGCGGNDKASEGGKITIGLTYVPDVQFAPFYVAEDKGYFKDEGVNVSLRHHGAQESLFGALGQGTEDVVVAGGDEMMQNRSNGIKVYNWATMYQIYPVKVIVPRDSSIRSAADLKGKAIGLPGKAGENYFSLQAMLKANGLTESDVKIQFIGYTQTAALTSGKVDAVIGFVNSDAVAVEAQGVPVRTIDPVEGGIPLVGAGLGSLDSFKEKGSKKERKILAALTKAVAYMRAHPEETLDIVRKRVPALADKKQRATASKVLSASMKLYGTGKFGAQDSAKWQKMADFMKEAGLLRNPVEVSQAHISLD